MATETFARPIVTEERVRAEMARKAALDEIDKAKAERDSCAECEDGEAVEREKKFLADQLAKERRAREAWSSADRGMVLLKSALDVQMRGWEYELRSIAPVHGEDGDVLRIGGHEATVRVPRGPEVTVVAFEPEMALHAALRGVLAAFSDQETTR